MITDKLPGRPWCYNSGPITGKSYLKAFNTFLRYDKVIRERIKMEPVNPMIHGLKSSRPYWLHIVYDLYLLFRCDSVAFQPEWEKSRGCRIEYKVAKMLGKNMIMMMKCVTE